MYILLNAKDLLIVISFRNISVLFVSSTAIWAIITTMNTITSPCKSPATPPRSEFSCPISGSLFITDVAFINIERIINIFQSQQFIGILKRLMSLLGIETEI